MVRLGRLTVTQQVCRISWQLQILGENSELHLLYYGYKGGLQMWSMKQIPDGRLKQESKKYE